MAGDWIKLEAVTPDKPEIYGIANELGIAPEEVVGRILRVWLWVDQQSLNGNALTVTKVTIDAIARKPGFAEAMRNVGWLEGSDGALSFPNFGRHNGKTAKERAVTARRVADHKKRAANELVTPTPLPREQRKSRGKSTTSLRSVELSSGSLLENQNTTLVTTSSVPTWESYSEAYANRYGVDPVRNAKVNSQLAQLVKRLGAVEAPAVAAFYVNHSAAFYVKARHPVDMLLRDAEGLRTQWATGIRSTSLEARSAEQVDSVRAQIERVGRDLEKVQ